METRANRRVRSEMSAQDILRSSHNTDSSVNANERRKVKRKWQLMASVHGPLE